MQVGNIQSPLAVVLMDSTSGNPMSAPLSVTLGTNTLPVTLGTNTLPVTLGTSTLAVHDPNPVAPTPLGANVTSITTNGTTTVDVGGGIYWGLSAVQLGTLWVASVYDVVGTATKTLVNALSVGVLGALGLVGPSGVPIKINGNLLVVTTGTIPGNLNVLWD